MGLATLVTNDVKVVTDDGVRRNEIRRVPRGLYPRRWVFVRTTTSAHSLEWRASPQRQRSKRFAEPPPFGL
jgi:hypothetical protein